MNNVKIEHKNVFVALCAAQSKMEPLTKTSQNGAFKTPTGKVSRYASLSEVVDVVRPALSTHGISFYHQIIEFNGGLGMRTTLCHGETETQLSCDVPLIVDKSNMQGMKSATTYAKRVGLESVTGVAPEDDDGNASVKFAPEIVEIDAALLADAKTYASRGVDAYRAFYKELKLEQRKQLSAKNTELQIIAVDADKAATFPNSVNQ